MVLALIVTVQVVLVPEHAPDHPVKVELALAVAVSVTTVPATKLVPVGLAVTVPVPVPVLVTARVYVVAVLKLAAIVWLAVTLEKVYELTAPTDTPSTVTPLILYPLFAAIAKVLLAP